MHMCFATQAALQVAGPVGAVLTDCTHTFKFGERMTTINLKPHQTLTLASSESGRAGDHAGALVAMVSCCD